MAEKKVKAIAKKVEKKTASTAIKAEKEVKAATTMKVAKKDKTAATKTTTSTIENKKETPIEVKEEEKKQTKIKNKKHFDIFKVLKSRYFIFAFLTVVCITAAFCLFLMDTNNYFRKKYMPFLDNVVFFKDLFKMFGIKEAEAGQGVSITSWLLFFIGFGLTYTGFIVWALLTPIKEIVIYRKEFSAAVIKKKKTIFNVIFFGCVGILLAAYTIILILFFPWKDVNFSTINAISFLNFLQCLGVLLLLFAIPIVALLLIMLIFKILVLIFVFFAGSVSKGVMKTQGYQEALATSQIINARLQKEALKELDKDAPVVLTTEQSQNVEDMVSSGEFGNYRPQPKYQSLNPAQMSALAQQSVVATCVFPALTAIDTKYEGKRVPSEEPIKLKVKTLGAKKPTTAAKKSAKKSQEKTPARLTPQNDPNNLIKDFALRFQAFLANKNDLYFSLDIIRAFIAGMNASRLILLEGLSGTGKTTLPRVFNQFVGGKSAFFPVQATWRDRSDVVGYYSDFTKQFKETEFLKTIYEASYTTNSFNIMVLDEMNISRVEYYFADFLSVLEYPKEEWLVPLINSEDDAKLPKHLMSGKVRIPSNTWFVGTINVDDSTFTVSDKVYDRVIVVDFKELSLPFTSKVDDSPWHMTPQELLGVFEYVTNSDIYHLSKSEKIKFAKLCEYTEEIFDIRFGNRVMNQIYYFVPVYVALGGTREEALDFMFARKILRKIDGKYENYISVGLSKLSKYLQTAYGKGHFKETNAYIDKLHKKLS